MLISYHSCRQGLRPSLSLAFGLWNTIRSVWGSCPLELGELGLEGKVSLISLLVANPQNKSACTPVCHIWVKCGAECSLMVIVRNLWGICEKRSGVAAGSSSNRTDWVEGVKTRVSRADSFHLCLCAIVTVAGGFYWLGLKKTLWMSNAWWQMVHQCC